MKKWYAITAILAVLLIISIGTCAIGSGGEDRCREDLADTEEQLDTVKQELNNVKSELANADDQLANTEDDLEQVRSELTQLKATKEIDFGNSLRVFDIEKTGYYARGKVQNISDTAMDMVVVLLAFYCEDGKLADVREDVVTDLFPQEVAEWEVSRPYCSGWDYAELFDLYAVGDGSAQTQ